MNDRNVSLRAVLAVTLWLLGVACILIQLTAPIAVGHLGLLLAMGGATLHVRGFFCHLIEQERNAFELGRDHERGLRSLH